MKTASSDEDIAFKQREKDITQQPGDVVTFFFVDGWANIFIEKYRVFMPSMIPVPGEMC